MSRDLLVEVGTEELPPKSLDALSQAFAENTGVGLRNLGLNFERMDAYATPRRLAVLVSGLDEQQPDEDIELLGPPVANAYDANGQPTAAAEGFARRCSCEVDQLQHKDTDKGPRLAFVEHKKGAATKDLLAPLLESALSDLPVARWMRWGASRIEFVRPIHWLVCLFGDEVVAQPIFGLTPGATTCGHRFLAPGQIRLDRPASYLRTLREQGMIIADPKERRAVIRFGVEKVAAETGGVARIDEDLLDEVNALVEFPVPMVGSFDKEFLEVPPEALISSMQNHQKYFPVTDEQGQLMPHFVFVANIKSIQPERVVEGNERVIRPRLADARFFYQVDREQPLASLQTKLQDILYQKQLGSLFDKTQRVTALATYLAEQVGADSTQAHRAGELCKCDLASEMVLEFDDLQGIMGRYYALDSGEDPVVAEAILEHYLPRHASDRLPESAIGVCLGIADRLDTLTGIFGIGQTPTGSKDPFGLRRASLAVVRLIVEKQLHLPLKQLIKRAAGAHEGLILGVEETTNLVFAYLLDRLPAWFEERQVAIEPVRAVLKLALEDLTDIVARVDAVKAFTHLESCSALSSANKRVSNLLDKVVAAQPLKLKTDRLVEPAEKDLAAALEEVSSRVKPLLEKKNYTMALETMSELREPVDRVFDEVMIMVDDEVLRTNRLALLSSLRQLFLRVADISELPSDF